MKIFFWGFFTLMLSHYPYRTMKRMFKQYHVARPKTKMFLVLLYIAVVVGLAVTVIDNKNRFYLVALLGLSPLAFVHYLFLKWAAGQPSDTEITRDDREPARDLFKSPRFWICVIILIFLSAYHLINYPKEWLSMLWRPLLLLLMIIMLLVATRKKITGEDVKDKENDM